MGTSANERSRRDVREVRYLGEFDANPTAVTKLVRKLKEHHQELHFCYEAGPTGYGLYRQITALGHDCTVVAPSMIPRRPGERVKTNRRDARALARLHRAGELTAVWVPDETHEAVRDLVRTRSAASMDYRRKRQHVTAFLLRHGHTAGRRHGGENTCVGWMPSNSPILHNGWPTRKC